MGAASTRLRQLCDRCGDGVRSRVPEFDHRRAFWAPRLQREGLDVEPDALDDVADRYRLIPGQIEEAVSGLRNLAHLRVPSMTVMRRAATCVESAPALFASARLQTGHDLGSLARKIDARYTWQDIVLPPDAVAQLREICQRVVYRRRVLDEWGFDRKLSLGKGVSALFTGPSGTGKTMAAEILATELALDLYKIDLSSVVSKWIGETEKNLDRIFTAAENANAILFFDEADALFGKRSEVRDSHDRYANVEISYLLQKMEEYEGIAILATNLRANLDEAFVAPARVHRAVSVSGRREPSAHLEPASGPTATPVAGDADARYLAKQFKLSGGNIKNIALASAVLAAADGGVVQLVARAPCHTARVSKAGEGRRTDGARAVIRTRKHINACRARNFSQDTSRPAGPKPLSGITALQRTAGNRAVSKALQSDARSGSAATTDPPPVVRDVLRSPGNPLDQETRACMESRFGHDFSEVRVHTGVRAAESARAVDATAYTVGRDVVFDAGQYVPHTTAGQFLLAHELAHVVQQGRGRTSSGDDNNASDRAADRAAAVITRGSGAIPPLGATAPGLARKPNRPPLTMPDEGIEMPWVGKGRGVESSELGYLRDHKYFWAEYQEKVGKPSQSKKQAPRRFWRITASR